jgi:hypothetical protein
LALSLLGFTAASVVIAHDQQPGRGDETPQAEDLVADVTTVKYSGSVADPDGRAPWTLRTHKGKTRKLTCFEVGQKVKGAFGRQQRHGFVDRSEGPTGGPSGSCAELRVNPSPLIVTAESAVVAGDGGRLLVYGILDERYTAVAISRAGKTIHVQPANDRTYLAVFEGDDEADLQVFYLAPGGGTKVY